MNTNIGDIVKPEAIQALKDLEAKLKEEALFKIYEKAAEGAIKLYEKGELAPEDIVFWRGQGIVFPERQMSVWSKISMLLNPSAISGLIAGNWKTTAKGLIKGIFVVLTAYNVNVPPELQETILEISSLIIGAYLVGKGALSKDTGR